MLNCVAVEDQKCCRQLVDELAAMHLSSARCNRLL
jgi:hypothetical protein